MKVSKAEGVIAMMAAYPQLSENPSDAAALWDKLLTRCDLNSDCVVAFGEWEGFVRNAANIGKLDSLQKQLDRLKARACQAQA